MLVGNTVAAPRESLDGSLQLGTVSTQAVAPIQVHRAGTSTSGAEATRGGISMGWAPNL